MVFFFENIEKQKWDSEYNIYLDNFTKDDRNKVAEISQFENISDDDLDLLDNIAGRIALKSVSDVHSELSLKKNQEKEKWNFENAWRICQCATSSSVLRLANEKKKFNNNDLFFVKSVRDGKLYLVRSKFSELSAKPRVQLIFADENLTINPGDFWFDIKTTGLDAEGGVEFKNGKKPLKFLKRILNSKKNQDITVLDFFAGSGSTLQAAIELNNLDGGNRKVILATNNENEICEKITYKRCENIIAGYSTSTKNIPGNHKNNLRYYKSEYVSRETSLKNKRQLTLLATELLCIKEDCYQDITSEFSTAKWFKLFSNSKGKIVCVIYDDIEIEAGISIIQQVIDKYQPQQKIKIYVFSNGQYPYTEDFEDILENIELCALPDAIYNAYQNVLPKRKRHEVPEIEDPTAEQVQTAVLDNDLFNQNSKN